MPSSEVMRLLARLRHFIAMQSVPLKPSREEILLESRFIFCRRCWGMFDRARISFLLMLRIYVRVLRENRNTYLEVFKAGGVLFQEGHGRDFVLTHVEL
jgi:hypothetical protein